MKLFVPVVAIVAGGVLLHLLALWMERRGWIYYKHNKPSRSALGNAFLEVQSILEPDKKHMIEVRSEMKKAAEQAGDEGDPDVEESTISRVS